MANFGRYTHAICARVPSSISKTVSENDNEGELNIEKARGEHEQLCDTLRKLGVDVIELPQDENLPFSCFVEDTAVVINGTALLTRPGNKDRRSEVDTIKNTLKRELQGLRITEIEDETATLDGSDILFTGKEIFVGLSSRTNAKGAMAVANTFPEYPTSPIKVTGGEHLKNVVCMAGPDIMMVADTKEAKNTLHRIEQHAEFRYKTITVPNIGAVNCVYANGTLIHRSEFHDTNKILKEKLNDTPHSAIPFGEVAGAGGSLSSCVLLINKVKRIKSI